MQNITIIVGRVILSEPSAKGYDKTVQFWEHILQAMLRYKSQSVSYIDVISRGLVSVNSALNKFRSVCSKSCKTFILLPAKSLDALCLMGYRPANTEELEVLINIIKIGEYAFSRLDEGPEKADNLPC